MPNLIIMCKPKNNHERKMLIDAGIITAAQQHSWVFLEKTYKREWVDSVIKVFSYWNVFTHASYKVRSFRLTAKQFVDVFNFTLIMPDADLANIVPLVEHTARNRLIIKYDHNAKGLLSEQYQ